MLFIHSYLILPSNSVTCVLLLSPFSDSETGAPGDTDPPSPTEPHSANHQLSSSGACTPYADPVGLRGYVTKSYSQCTERLSPVFLKFSLFYFQTLRAENPQFFVRWGKKKKPSQNVILFYSATSWHYLLDKRSTEIYIDHWYPLTVSNSLFSNFPVVSLFGEPFYIFNQLLFF